VGAQRLTAEQANQLLTERPSHPELHADSRLPDDTRLWAALQRVGGGTWGGCVYDVDKILQVLEAGWQAQVSKEPAG
jgi:hypothetical protein